MRSVSDRVRRVGRGAILVVASCALVRGVSRALGDEVAALLERLEEHAAGVVSVETGFVQNRKLAVFKRSLVLRGKVYIQQPERFAWHLEEPVRTRLVLDGSRMRQWDEMSGEVQTLRLDKNPALRVATSQVWQWFSGSYSGLRSEYEIGVVSEAPVTLRFVPRDGCAAGEFIEKVTVTFRDDERYIQAIEIVEKGGDSTSMVFTDTILNGDIPEEAWQVEP